MISLLKMAQLDTNTVTFKQEDLFNKLLKPFEIQIDLKNICIKKDIQQNNLNHLDISWTLEALSNILKNNIEHIQEEGTISIKMNQNPLYTEIIIQDNGPGIDKEDLPHLFERFYKAKNATNQSIGIGLALSCMILEKQNGTIHVENTFPGAKFMIHFYHEII